MYTCTITSKQTGLSIEFNFTTDHEFITMDAMAMEEFDNSIFDFDYNLTYKILKKDKDVTRYFIDLITDGQRAAV